MSQPIQRNSRTEALLDLQVDETKTARAARRNANFADANEVGAYVKNQKSTDAPLPPKSAPKEDGHGLPAAPSVTPRQAALAQNAEIDKHNAPLDQRIEFLTRMAEAIKKVCSHGLAGDAYLSKDELTQLMGSSSDPAQRVAAEFLLANYEQIPAPKHAAWGGGMNTREMLESAAILGREILSVQGQRRQRVPVPDEPSSERSALTGRASNTSSTAAQLEEAAAQEKKPRASSNKKDEAQKADSDFKAFDAVKPFSSKSTSPDERLSDALGHIQTSLAALDEDFARAAAAGDQAAMARIQTKKAALQAGFTGITQMMHQRYEMQSNLLKMFSEMSMSAIRNMR